MVKRSHDPATGLPIHRWADKDGPLVAGLIATRAELGRQRRRVADGQQPVGALWVLRRYVPLYVVADSEALPPLSAKRQAAWDAVRTCANCGARNRNPWPTRVDTGARWCWGCVQAQNDTAVLAQRNVDRATSEGKALSLLCDPQLVVLACEPLTDPERPGLVRISAVDRDGWLMVSHTYTQVRRGPWPPEATAALTAALEPLRGRRLVSWKWLGYQSLIGDLGRAAWSPQEAEHYDTKGWVTVPSNPIEQLRQDLYRAANRCQPGRLDSDALDLIVSRWRPIEPPTPWSYGNRDDLQAYLAVYGTPVEPLALLHLLILNAVAAGRHPAGPARCPHRRSAATPPCGATSLTPAGLCPAHTPTGQGAPS